MKRPIACAFASIASLAIATSGAMAQDRVGDARDKAALESPTKAGAAPSLFGAQAVSEATLQAIAGREDTTQVSQANLAAGVSRNSVGDNSTTGAAQIDGNAFQNMSGLSILNVNTGNNVAINAAMNVNVSITQAP